MAGFLRQYYETAKHIIIKPIDFYKGMPITGGFKDPLIFAIITAVILGIGETVKTLGDGVLAIIIVPIIVTISLFLGALLLQLCSKILGGTGTYEAMMRVMAYAYIVNILSWIHPGVSILGALYGMVLTVLGIRETHKLTTLRAIIAILIVIAIVFILALVMAVIGIGITGYIPPTR
jgi:hypothetical protein